MSPSQAEASVKRRRKRGLGNTGVRREPPPGKKQAPPPRYFEPKGPPPGVPGFKSSYGPTHRIGGYPKGDELQSWDGKPIGKIVRKTCRKVRPGERGAWISNERCSYVVDIDGRRYTGRGRGDGIAVNLRQMKRRR